MMIIILITPILSYFLIKWTPSFGQMKSSSRQMEKQRKHLEQIISDILARKQDLAKLNWGQEYFGFTHLLQELLGHAKKTGLPMQQPLRRIRTALGTRGKFERHLQQEKMGAMMQIILMSAMVWAMALTMVLQGHVTSSLTSASIILGMQILPVLLFNYGITKFRAKYLEGFPLLLCFHHGLHAFLGTGQGVSQAMTALKGEHVFSLLGHDVRDMYFIFLQRLRMGMVVSEEWDHLETDITYYQDEALEKFQKVLQGLKMAATLMAGPGSFLFLLFQVLGQYSQQIQGL